MEIVTADIGGTHARFAIAKAGAGRIVLSSEVVLKTAQHASLQSAWEAYGAQLGRPLPRAAGIAVACPVQGDTLKFTNNPWIIRVSALEAQLGLDELTLINDFAAVGHAVANLDDGHFRPLCGPQASLPIDGVISVVGPGTGLGVSQVVRHRSGYEVISTEGGHISFAPVDRLEDQILAHLRQRYLRVSAERIISGPGLANLYAALAAIEQRPARVSDDKSLWEAALTGSDQLAAAALERFCLCLGACAGDIALAQGASAVVIAGGLGLRIADHLTQAGFSQRFIAKGRFESMMAAMPVKLITHPQPGLYGAAAAYQWMKAHPKTV
ncbi:MAG: glucokinase [Hyphomonadaceae bacterium]|nr:glucokinase [Hyphomonadaceae bacterium]